MVTTAEWLSWKSSSLTFIILGSTPKLDQDTSQSHTQRGQRCWSHLHGGGTTMVWCFLCARDLRAPDSALRWIHRRQHDPPGWCNGAESISTRLLEPPSAVIVITHPGPVSQPTIYAICTQMWNYEAASHKRDRLSWLHRFLHHRDYDDGFTHQRIVSENWRWFPEEMKWPLTVLGSSVLSCWIVCFLVSAAAAWMFHMPLTHIPIFTSFSPISL